MELEMLENGKVVLPVSLRRRLGIKIGGTLDVYMKNEGIILSPKRKSESELGDDSPLCGAMGFVRKSERKSGLSKKKKTP